MRQTGQGSSERLIAGLASQINRWRLAQPAILFLEVIKPLTFVAGQGLLLCEPLLEFFFTESQVGEYADLLADRSNVEHLIARLELDSLGGDHGDERKG